MHLDLKVRCTFDARGLVWIARACPWSWPNLQFAFACPFTILKAEYPNASYFPAPFPNTAYREKRTAPEIVPGISSITKVTFRPGRTAAGTGDIVNCWLEPYYPVVPLLALNQLWYDRFWGFRWIPLARRAAQFFCHILRRISHLNVTASQQHIFSSTEWDI